MNLQWDHINGLLIAVTIKTGRRVDLPRSSWQIPFQRAFCKTKIFVQNQGMREILPQAYD